jgi:tyrosinase
LLLICKIQQTIKITSSELTDAPQFNRCKGTTRHAKLRPDSNVEQDWIGGVQQNDSIVQGLRSNESFKDIMLEGHLRATLSDAFYRVAIIPKFEDFGTKRVGDWRKGTNRHVFGSAENLHDFIHSVCGGNAETTQLKEEGRTVVLQGHMSKVPVAAFDPIFWLHHWYLNLVPFSFNNASMLTHLNSNVDRMVAIWEVLHRDTPNNWFDGKDERDKDPGNWAIEHDQVDLPSDELHPFHKNEKGDYWTSNDVRETAPLGYAYPELEKWKHVDTEGKYNLKKHQEELIKYLNFQYNSAAKAAVKANLTADPHDADTSKPTLHQLHLQAVLNPTPGEDIIGYPDYVANIVYDRYIDPILFIHHIASDIDNSLPSLRFALGGHPYTISIFIGQVPLTVPYTFSDPEGSLVGQVYTFSSPADQLGTDRDVGCVNCRSQEASWVLSSGSVALTNPLITRWKNALVHTPRQRFASDPGVEAHRVLSSMHPEDVVPFLKTNLRWRVTSMTGDLVPVESLQSLRVSVAVGKADHFADQTKLSRFYDYKGAFDVTRGRPQGARPEDGMYPSGWEGA